MQVDQVRTVREVMKMNGPEFDSTLRGASMLVNSFGEIYTAAVPADNGVAASLENPIVLWSQPSDINPEGTYAPQVAVMTCTPETGYFEFFDRSQVRITSAKFLQRERLLNEMKIAKPQARREVGEHQIPTVAQDDTNNGMIQELLKELEELDELHELSEEDEAMIDALVQGLELEIPFPVRDERIELIAEMEETEAVVKCWDTFEVSAPSIRQVKEASSSAIMFKAEGKCSAKGSHFTGRFERPNSLIPIEVIQQHPDIYHRRRLWVRHRKHGRRKMLMGLRGMCRPTRRKHGK